MNSKEDIKLKLEALIKDRMISKGPVYPFGDYFSDATFKRMLDDILNAQAIAGIIHRGQWLSKSMIAAHLKTIATQNE